MSQTPREEVMRQVREAQEETSATMTADALLYPDLRREESARSWWSGLLTRRVRVVLVLLALLTLAFGTYSVYTATFAKPTSAMFVTGVRELAQLATAEAHVMTTLEGQDNKIFGVQIPLDVPGTKRIYFLVVPAKVLAGVDLKNLSADDIRVDHERKTVEISLPHAEFLEESIQFEGVKMFTDQGLFRAKLSAQEGIDLMAQADIRDKLRAEAGSADVLKMAESNAAKAMQGLYREFGYEVNVTFR